MAPPLPIPNRTVKRLCADDSDHSIVKVGHRQAIQHKPLLALTRQGFFILSDSFEIDEQSRQPNLALALVSDIARLRPCGPERAIKKAPKRVCLHRGPLTTQPLGLCLKRRSVEFLNSTAQPPNPSSPCAWVRAASQTGAQERRPMPREFRPLTRSLLQVPQGHCEG